MLSDMPRVTWLGKENRGSIPPSHAGSPTPLDPYCVCVLAGME